MTSVTGLLIAAIVTAAFGGPLWAWALLLTLAVIVAAAKLAE